MADRETRNTRVVQRIKAPRNILTTPLSSVLRRVGMGRSDTIASAKHNHWQNTFIQKHLDFKGTLFEKEYAQCVAHRNILESPTVDGWSQPSDMNNRVTSQQSFCSVAPRVVVRLSLAHDQLAAKTNKGSCAPKLDKGGNQMAVL